MLSMLISKYCEVYARDPDSLPELCYEVDGALYAAELTLDLADPEASIYTTKLKGVDLDSLENVKKLYAIACKLSDECVTSEELSDQISERGYHSDDVFDTLQLIGAHFHHFHSQDLETLDDLCGLILQVLP